MTVNTEGIYRAAHAHHWLMVKLVIKRRWLRRRHLATLACDCGETKQVEWPPL